VASGSPAIKELHAGWLVESLPNLHFSNYVSSISERSGSLKKALSSGLAPFQASCCVLTGAICL
jgi:hypothetical protein